ncbi:MAG: cell division transport system ATP-binding protein [Hyphomicrobiaceae bacterium]|jgi:cell division transport system ATP-binding protein
MIRLHGLTKKYQRADGYALRDVNLHVRAGELVALTGPSGCGRTTLLRVLLGREQPDSGSAIIVGRNLSRAGATGLAELRRRTGLVMDECGLVERMTVLQNVALAAQVGGWPYEQSLRMAEEAIARVSLQSCAPCLPRELCTGERKRASLARALVTTPDVILADEPTAGMDPDQALEVLQLLTDAADEGAAVVIACNDLELLGSVRGRVLVLNEGRLYEENWARRACA